MKCWHSVGKLFLIPIINTSLVVPGVEEYIDSSLIALESKHEWGRVLSNYFLYQLATNPLVFNLTLTEMLECPQVLSYSMTESGGSS